MSAANPYAAAGGLDTPYKRARDEWDDRIGSSRVQARNWRMLALMSNAALLAAIGGMIYLGGKPPPPPLYIEIDKLGDAAVQQSSAAASYTPPDYFIQHQLRHFVDIVRRVTADPVLTSQGWTQAWDFATVRGRNMLKTYIEPVAFPAERARLGTVTVDPQTPLKITDGSWQIDWTERAWDTKGKLDHQSTWRGTFHVLIHPSSDPKVRAVNPVGLYVDEFNWIKLRD